MEARVQRARAHERAARMYSGFGEKSKALAHARRALFLRFGTPPRLEVSQDAYDKLVKEKRGARGQSARFSASLTDTHGGIWSALGDGAAGVVMKPEGEVLPAHHPLYSVRTKVVLKIVTRVEGAKVEKSEEGYESEGFLEDEVESSTAESPPAESPPRPPAPLYPDQEAVLAEFNMMSLPGLKGLVPATYGTVVVGDKTVGYAMERFEMSLREHITKKGMDSKMEEKVYELIKGVCAVVSCLDVKPDNVVVSASGDVRMIDFGPDLCTSKDGKSPEQKSPEQIETDVLMCTLLFCLAACNNDVQLDLPMMTATLLDSAYEPRKSVVEKLEKLSEFYPKHDRAVHNVYASAIVNVQAAQCFRDPRNKRWKKNMISDDFTVAGDLIQILSRLNKDKAEASRKKAKTAQAGFGRDRRRRHGSPCAIS
jgi:hypothetical protein